MTALQNQLPEPWREQLEQLLPLGHLEKIAAFLQAEKAAGKTIFPPEECRFAALHAVAPHQIKVVILGQDPYHDEHQAHGLAFSVPDGVKPPPSLKNIFKELNDDLQILPPQNGNLSKWAAQGVLLLNTVLTVAAHQPLSHRKLGWEEFTDAVIKIAAAQTQKKVFVLWGAPAQSKRGFIDEKRDLVLASAHPSPLSAYRGFFGSRPFSQANRFLTAHGVSAIDWSLAESDNLKLEFK